MWKRGRYWRPLLGGKYGKDEIMEMETKPKLEMLKRIVRLGEWSECARVMRRADRRLMIKLRGGTAGFQIETGRWRGVTRQERVCKECDSGEVEDVYRSLVDEVRSLEIPTRTIGSLDETTQ